MDRAESVRMYAEETANSARARAGTVLAEELEKIVRGTSDSVSADANGGGKGGNLDEDRHGRETT